MSAVVESTTSLSILVPASLLPGEGEDLTLANFEGSAVSAGELFRVFKGFAAPRAASFLLDSADVQFDGELHEESALQLINISSDEESGEPHMDVRPAMSHFDWAGVLQEVSEALHHEHFLGTPEELARVFTEAVREMASIAALGFAGEAVPLLTISTDAETKAVKTSFLGIWLAESRAMTEVRQTLPGQSWHDGSSVGQNHFILLDAAEVEGRGLKEAILSAAMLALVFAGTSAKAEDAVSVGRPAAGGKYTSFFNRDTRPGEKLEVKTQKLVQDGPRYYRDVLDREHSDLRVIVNIGAQRAFLVKDGQIAFETPISTGRGSRMTPRGTFTITEKVRKGKMSTIYKCPLPGWMRIGEMPIGMHEGELPGYPASHGCIRMPLESAHFIFDRAPKGTTVQIVDSWTPPVPGAGTLVATNN
ncbi:MAG: L,D-transpeptidase [Verrucomicrobium sp.]